MRSLFSFIKKVRGIHEATEVQVHIQSRQKKPKSESKKTLARKLNIIVNLILYKGSFISS